MHTINLKIITPKSIVLQGEVRSVSAPSAEGEITILPGHINLFSLLEQGIVKIKKKQDEDYLAIGGGYLQTDGDDVNILVSKAYGQDEINEKMIKNAVEDAKKILTESKDREERNKASAILRRSFIDLRLLRKRKHL